MTNEETILEEAEKLAEVRDGLKSLIKERAELAKTVEQKSKELMQKSVDLEEKEKQHEDKILDMWPDKEQKNVKGKGLTVTRAVRKRVFCNESSKGYLKGLKGLGKIMKQADIDLERKTVGLTVEDVLLDEGKILVEESAGIKVRRGHK
jgi:hypothetical protein